MVMVDVVECPLDVGVHYPLFPLVRAGEQIDFADGIMATSPRTDPVTASLKSCFPFRLNSVLDPGLEAAIKDSRDSEGPLFAVGLRDVHAPYRIGTPRLKGVQIVH